MSFKIWHVYEENHKLLTGMMNKNFFQYGFYKVPEEARLWPRAKRAEGQNATALGSIKLAFFPSILKQSQNQQMN